MKHAMRAAGHQDERAALPPLAAWWCTQARMPPMAAISVPRLLHVVTFASVHPRNEWARPGVGGVVDGWLTRPKHDGCGV